MVFVKESITRELNSNYQNAFTANIEIPTHYFENNQKVHMCVLETIIPISYYLIRNDRDTFELSEDGGTIFNDVTLTHGNYNFNTIVTELQTQLNSTGNFTYTVSKNSTSQPQNATITITVTGNSGTQPIIRFISSSDDLFDVLGFNTTTSYTFSSDTLITPSIINMNPETVLKIHSDAISSHSHSNLLLSVLNDNSPPFGTVYYRMRGNLKVYSKHIPSMTKTARFYITNQFDKLIDLNEQNWYIRVLIWIEDDLIDRVKNFFRFFIKRKDIQDELKEEEENN